MELVRLVRVLFCRYCRRYRVPRPGQIYCADCAAQIAGLWDEPTQH